MSKRDVIADLFRRNRGRWISLLVLLRIAPAQYSKRISDLRRDGMAIECRQRVVKVGNRREKRSEYRHA
jgi:hypothetical protein